MPKVTKTVTETRSAKGYRSRSPTHRGGKVVEKTETVQRRKGEINLWEEEWNNCPPSTSDCYYYIWNFTHDNYYCPEERDLLGRGVYSKYEIDDFLDELKENDLHRVDKHPVGWYYCLSAFAVLGIGLILTGLYLWYNFLSEGFKWFWIIIAVIIFIVAAVLMCCACFYCCRPRHRHLRRRDDMMPSVDAENRRIYHRGLNWRMSELGSYMALRTNYNGPVGGYRRRNPLEEEAMLMGRDKHAHVPMMDSTKRTTDVRTTQLQPVGRTSVVEHSRVASPARSIVSERVMEVRSADEDVNSIYRSNMYETNYQGGYQSNNYDSQMASNNNRGSYANNNSYNA